jgi:lipopolysaccharide assembly protein A
MNAKELTIAAQQNQIMELQKLVPADDPDENEKES